MKNSILRHNLENSKESVSRGAERILNVQHPRTYKDIVTNFSSSSSIVYSIFLTYLLIDATIIFNLTNILIKNNVFLDKF
nr:palindromic element RPE5 domain-containing protein [Rickettsia asiatica]